jgi:hypothetical protein
MFLKIPKLVTIPGNISFIKVSYMQYVILATPIISIKYSKILSLSIIYTNIVITEKTIMYKNAADIFSACKSDISATDDIIPKTYFLIRESFILNIKMANTKLIMYPLFAIKNEENQLSVILLECPTSFNVMLNTATLSLNKSVIKKCPTS